MDDRRPQPDFLRTICGRLTERSLSNRCATCGAIHAAVRDAIMIGHGIRVCTDLPVHLPVIAGFSLWYVVALWRHDVANSSNLVALRLGLRGP